MNLSLVARVWSGWTGLNELGWVELGRVWLVLIDLGSCWAGLGYVNLDWVEFCWVLLILVRLSWIELHNNFFLVLPIFFLNFC